MVWFRRVGFTLIGLLVAAQFVQPELNTAGQTEGDASFVAVLQPPARLRAFLAESCYDCHSDRTRYPWYARIQPAGWLIDRHVRNGRRAVNFSTFAELGAKARMKRLEYVEDAVLETAMPPATYQMTHPASVADTATIMEFLHWIEGVQKRQAVPNAHHGDE